MSFREHLRHLVPHIEWWGIEWLCHHYKEVLGTVMLTVLGAIVQRVQGVPYDWWVLGILFFGSLGLMIYSHRRDRRQQATVDQSNLIHVDLEAMERNSSPLALSRALSASTTVDTGQIQEGASLSSLVSPQNAANREKIVVLVRVCAYPAYAIAQQVTNRLWDRVRNSDDGKDLMIADLVKKYPLASCGQASSELNRAVNSPDKENTELLQQRLLEFYDAYRMLVYWANLVSGFYSFPLNGDPEYNTWQEKHKLFYHELMKIIASDDFFQLRRRLRGQWYNILG